MRVLLIFLFVTNFCFSSSSSADSVLLVNGDILTGSVVTKNEKELIFSTDYAGELTINLESVKQITADTPLEAVLKDGSVETADRFAVSETPLDDGYRLRNVLFINPTDSQKGGWDFKGNINAALKFERGNNDIDELDFDGAAEIRTKSNRFVVRGALENDESENVKTEDSWKVSGKYDRFLNKRLFTGFAVSSEQDRFSDLENRTIGGPHIGYQFYENERMNLSVEVSGNRVREKFTEGTTDYYNATGWATNFDYYIVMDSLQFYHRNDGLLNIDNTDKYLFNAYTGLRWPIVFGIIWSIEHTFEFDSEPASNAEEYDHTYNAKLGYEW